LLGNWSGGTFKRIGGRLLGPSSQVRKTRISGVKSYDLKRSQQPGMKYGRKESYRGSKETQENGKEQIEAYLCRRGTGEEKADSE